MSSNLEWRKKNPERWAKYMREYSRKNRDHINKMQRVRRIKRLYGLTSEQYEEMFSKQKGGCAICQKPPLKYKLAVDHCHITGKVRGLLCAPCNRALGVLGDSGDALLRVVQYLTKERVI